MTIQEQAARLVHKAVGAGYRLEEARMMTIRQLIAVSNLESHAERERMRFFAICGRMAQASEQGWAKAMKNISDDQPEYRQETIEAGGFGVDEALFKDDPAFQIPEELQ